MGLAAAPTLVFYYLIPLVIALVFSGIGSADASIHVYDRDPFREVGNAYLLSGGSEGISASRTTSPLLHRSIHDGRSYIQFENITFWRSKASASQHSKMAHSTGLIQVILFEAADRDNIGGSPYGGQRSICCTPDLAKLEGCKQGTINDISGRARVFLVLPDAFLDAFLILWIFTSLSKTLEELQAKRSSVKLDIYRKFSNALAVTVIVSVAWIGYEVYFKATDPFNERWQRGWIISAFWDILAFLLLCVICYLWAPSQSSQRYAYSVEKDNESDEEEAQTLVSGSPKGDISLVKQERRDKNGESKNVFDPEDDAEEEGKRE